MVDRKTEKSEYPASQRTLDSVIAAESLEDGSLDPDELDCSDPSWWDEGVDDED